MKDPGVCTLYIMRIPFFLLPMQTMYYLKTGTRFISEGSKNLVKPRRHQSIGFALNYTRVQNLSILVVIS